MTVKQMISELNKMPGHLEVAVAAHDNAEWEAGGWPCSVDHIIKRDYSQPVYGADEERMFRDMPEEYVVLHC